MGLLGMMAAGAGRGLRDTHEANVRAQNQLEIAQIQHGMNLDQEALREKYLTRREGAQREYEQEKEVRKNMRDDDVYKKTRDDELADKEAGRKHDITRDMIREGGANSRNAMEIAADDRRLAAGAPSRRGGGSTRSGASKPSKFMEQIEADVRSGLAPDEASAIKSRRLAEIAAGLRKSDPQLAMQGGDAVWAEANKEYSRLYPSAPTTPVGPILAPKVPEVAELFFDPKTGKVK